MKKIILLLAISITFVVCSCSSVQKEPDSPAVSIIDSKPQKAVVIVDLETGEQVKIPKSEWLWVKQRIRK